MCICLICICVSECIMCAHTLHIQTKCYIEWTIMKPDIEVTTFTRLRQRIVISLQQTTVIVLQTAADVYSSSEVRQFFSHSISTTSLFLFLVHPPPRSVRSSSTTDAPAFPSAVTLQRVRRPGPRVIATMATECINIIDIHGKYGNSRCIRRQRSHYQMRPLGSGL